jgi:hypothetical protein
MNQVKNLFALNEIQILKSLGKNEDELILPELAHNLGYEELDIINDEPGQQSIEDKEIRAGWRR